MCFVYVLVSDVAFVLMDLFCNRNGAKNSRGEEKPANTEKVRLGHLRLRLNAVLCRTQKETRKRPLASEFVEVKIMKERYVFLFILVNSQT